MKVYSKKSLLIHINSFKTKAAQKAALTREIKQLKEILKDEEKAYKKRSYDWLLGEKIYSHNLRNTKYNIEICEKIKKEIK